MEEIIRTIDYYYQKTIRQIDMRNAIGTNILDMRRNDVSYLVNPIAKILIHEKDAIFVLGTKDQIITLKYYSKNENSTKKAFRAAFFAR